MITCTKFRPVQKGCLIGFGSIEIEKWGVEIHNVSLNEKNGGWWASMPSQVYEKDGEKKYSPYVTFKSKETYKKFQDACVEAMKLKMNETSEPSFSEPGQSNLDEEIPF